MKKTIWCFWFDKVANNIQLEVWNECPLNKNQRATYHVFQNSCVVSKRANIFSGKAKEQRKKPKQINK